MKVTMCIPTVSSLNFMLLSKRCVAKFKQVHLHASAVIHRYMFVCVLKQNLHYYSCYACNCSWINTAFLLPDYM